MGRDAIAIPTKLIALVLNAHGVELHAPSLKLVDAVLTLPRVIAKMLTAPSVMVYALSLKPKDAVLTLPRVIAKTLTAPSAMVYALSLKVDQNLQLRKSHHQNQLAQPWIRMVNALAIANLIKKKPHALPSHQPRSQHQSQRHETSEACQQAITKIQS